MKNIAENTKYLLNKYHLKALKKYGQNFLIDMNILKQIASSAALTKETSVIEIGPGLGGLTEVLCQEAGEVFAYEIDQRMIDILNHELEYDNLTVIGHDFMKEDMHNLDIHYQDIVVVSNLPYYITTDIITKIVTSDLPIRTLIGLIQKETALKMTGNYKTALSLMIEYIGSIEYLFTVSRDVFIPVPHVDSAVIKIEKERVISKELIELLKLSFQQRRKTIGNNLKTFISKEELLALGIDSSKRAEHLHLDEFIKINERRKKL